MITNWESFASRGEVVDMLVVVEGFAWGAMGVEGNYASEYDHKHYPNISLSSKTITF